MNKTTLRHIMIKQLNANEKEKILKAARERYIRYRGKKKNDSIFLVRNNANQKTEEQDL